MIICYTSQGIWCAVEVNMVTIEKIPETESLDETWMLKAYLTASPDDVLTARLKNEEAARRLQQCIYHNETITLDQWIYFTNVRSEPVLTTKPGLEKEDKK